MEDNSLDEMTVTLEIEEVEQPGVQTWRDNDKGTWIWFRYIFPKDADDRKIQTLTRQCVALFVVSGSPKFLSWGVEALDEAGQSTNLHLHIVLYTEKECDAKDIHKGRLATLRRAFTRDNLYLEPKKTWVKTDPTIYGMELFKDFKSPERALRYCWKQAGQGLSDLLKRENSYKQKHYHTMLPPEMNIELEYKAATEEYEHSSAARYKTYKKKMAPTSCDKLLAHLEQLDNPPTTKKDSMVEMLKYYAEKEQPANKLQLQGYVVIWLLRRGIVSYDEMADNFLVGM